MSDALDDPILNGPYDPPERFFTLGAAGPTGEVQIGRRPSESWIRVGARKGRKAVQQLLDFDITGERREANTLINDVRRRGHEGLRGLM
jgi:type III restriction enzyme